MTMAKKICLRCGYCCQTSFVSIVVDPNIGPVLDNIKAINTLEERCPHFIGDKAGEYECAIHDLVWFPSTGCGQYNGWVSGRHDRNCPMGEYILGVGSKLRMGVTCPGCRKHSVVHPNDRDSLFPCSECGYDVKDGRK